MFPLADFLKRHGTPVEGIDQEVIAPLFPGGLPESVKVGGGKYSANVPGHDGGYFEIIQSGAGERGIWRTWLIILPDSFTAVLIECERPDRTSGVVTLCIDSIVSARYVPGELRREASEDLKDD